MRDRLFVGCKQAYGVEGTVTLKRMGANEKGSAMPINEVIELLSR